jgi:uncharacterized protein
MLIRPAKRGANTTRTQSRAPAAAAIAMNEALQVGSWRARPRSFVALMGLYESNYIRLHWLAGELSELSGAHRSCVSGDCDLLLTLAERSPYTSTLNLTYVLPGTGVPERFPDMRLRVYHDARLAEALEWADSHQRPLLRALRQNAERELDQRWGRNMMLNKWLEYCVERGHRFSPATRYVAGL